MSPHAPTLEQRLEALAADVARLRRGTRETEFDWHVDRIATELGEIILGFETTTAADLIKVGFTPEQACRYVDRVQLRVRRLIGDDERSLRLAGLIH